MTGNLAVMQETATIPTLKGELRSLAASILSWDVAAGEPLPATVTSISDLHDLSGTLRLMLKPAGERDVALAVNRVLAVWRCRETDVTAAWLDAILSRGVPAWVLPPAVDRLLSSRRRDAFMPTPADFLAACSAMTRYANLARVAARIDGAIRAIERRPPTASPADPAEVASLLAGIGATSKRVPA